MSRIIHSRITDEFEDLKGAKIIYHYSINIVYLTKAVQRMQFNSKECKSCDRLDVYIIMYVAAIAMQ